MGDINEKLIERWSKDAAGKDPCDMMSERLTGILSLEGDPDTKTAYDNLVEKGFDLDKMINLIGQCCEVMPVPEEEIVPDEAIPYETEPE